ncbi:MAG: hypothetical protein QM586_16105 [Xenophilus sp.]
MKPGIKRRIQAVLRAGADRLAQRPALKRTLVKWLRLIPVLDRRLRAAVAPADLSPPPTSQPSTSPQTEQDLSRPARDVLAALRAGMSDSEHS